MNPRLIAWLVLTSGVAVCLHYVGAPRLAVVALPLSVCTLAIFVGAMDFLLNR